MFYFNRDATVVDDGEYTPIQTSTQTATPMSNADISAASTTAAIELAMTPYTELSAAERAAMTEAEKIAYLKAARNEQDAIAAELRAASNPMFDFMNRPDAPPPSAIPGENFIYYYSWLGDTNNGQWTLYRAANTELNLQTYGSRAIGGPTQATPGNPQGANALAVQPQPITDDKGNFIGWSTDGTTSTTSTNSDGSSTSSYKTVSKQVKNADGTTTVTYTDGSTKVFAAGKIVPTGFSNFTTSSSTTNGSSTTNNSLTSNQYNERVSVYAAMADRFQRYGLTGLAEKIKQLAMEGASEATITLQLQDTPEYQMRFSANADRIKKGLAVLTPAEYVNVEDTYRQVLRAYGLTQFDNDAYVKQFIANDMSPTELSNRVVTAVQRVRNADPAIGKTLKDYYGITSSDLVAYVLDPNQQFQKIERQVAAAEIGTAARVQGLEAGVAVAEQLAAQGITQAEAQKGYSTIADILPTATKLSDIYGNTMEGYGQSEGEQEVFNSLASAQRKRQRLGARETAQFKASSGLTKTSLDTATKGNF